MLNKYTVKHNGKVYHPGELDLDGFKEVGKQVISSPEDKKPEVVEKEDEKPVVDTIVKAKPKKKKK